MTPRTPDEILASLDPEQREVATSLQGPVRVLAGAGTGKTRAITHRIAYGVATGTYVATEVLAVTFTTRAAGEMRGRLRALGADGVQARTFHSAALRQARFFWPRVFGGELPEIAASKIPLLVEAARKQRISTAQPLLRDVAAEIEWAKVSNVRPDDYERLSTAAGRAAAGLTAAEVGRVFSSYEEVKRERGRIDMEDILLCGAALLAEDERVAAQIRRQYHWFVVDEYQDVNPIQQALLDLWLGGRDSVCVVGDPLQTIYSFAGASPRHLTDFHRRHPDATRVDLWRNYRSTPQVIEAANHVFQTRHGGRRAGVELRSQQVAGDPVGYHGHPDEVAEAAAVAAEIGRLREAGISLSQVAVLFRINAQSQSFEEALSAAGIPYVTRGVERFFERAAVKQAVTLLRGAARAGTDTTGDLVADTRSILATMNWRPTPPTSTEGRQREQWESLAAVMGLAEELATARPEATLTDLVADLERRSQIQHAPVAEGVTLATLHSAKGLEWDAVFLTGMHEGTMPIVYADTWEAVEEERRLFYVGVTRARRHLSVSWAAARTPGGRGNRSPSRFLDGLRPADVVTDQGLSMRPPGRKRSRGVAHCRVCNRALGNGTERKLGRCEDCPASYDEQVFEALREWRTQHASQRKVPAYCIVTDATLTAIAESRPSNPAELVAIPGIGPAKLAQYADELLSICAP